MPTKSDIVWTPDTPSLISVISSGSCAGDPPIHDVGVFPGYKTRSNIIEYSNGRRQTNRCNHVSENISCNMGSITATPTFGTGCTQAHVYTPAALAALSDHDVRWPSLSTGQTTWPSLSSRAVAAMWPEVESAVSAGNFILELPEVRDIPRFLPDLVKLAKSKAGPLKKLVKSLSSGTLFSEFSLRPLMSDVLGFHRAWQNACEQADRILKNEGKVLTSHYRTQLTSISESRTDTFTVPVQTGVVHRYDRDYQNLGSWYTATMRYSYRLLDYQRELAHQLAFYDALGLNLNLSVIWNALPWSFVIDWFARVGDFLEQTKLRNLEPIVSIDGFCHSYKSHQRITQYFTAFEGAAGAGGKFQTRCYDGVTYYREPYVPDTYTAIQLSGLNTREFVLSTALAGSRKR